MSKIMRAMYAEARADRERSASGEGFEAEEIHDHSSRRMAPQGVDRGEEEVFSHVATLDNVMIAVFAATKHPCSATDHANWWKRRRL